MPERDQPLDLLRELRDVGVTPPRAQVLHIRVSSAIAEEIEREHNSRRGGLNSSSPGRSTAERSGGAHRRLGFARLAGGLVPAVGVLVVALVVAVFFGLHGSGPSSTPSNHGSVGSRHGSVELVYLAEPSAQAPAVSRGALERTVDVMRQRLRALGIGGAYVSVSSANEITVALPNDRNTPRAEREVGTTAQLSLYDWEANALTPNGKPVASQLQAHDPTALTISQGAGGNSAPGDPGSGSMGLYQAVQLASKQQGWLSSANSRIGSQYWLFGAPGSAACTAAARAQGTVPVAGQHCLLSGPDDNLTNLRSGLPSGVSASEGQILTVARGWVVLQAIPASFSHQTAFTSPSAQFFVLKDNIALRSSDITNPQQSTDQAGNPDVTFGFTSTGKSEFQNVTSTIAHRGQRVSGLNQQLNQHFAVALDNELITVPQIDFKTYPDGINGDNGADISGSFSITDARSLAAELRLGALPLNLKLICEGAPATTPCHSPRVR